MHNHKLPMVPFQPLYTEHLALNELGQDAARQVDAALGPLYAKLYQQGVSPRDLTGLIASCASGEEARLCIGHGITLRKHIDENRRPPKKTR